MNEVEFTSRVKRCSRKLYCVAYSILWNDADCLDAVQEAVARVWMRLGRLQNEAYFETYLVRTLINRCKSMRRPKRFITVGLSRELEKMQGDLSSDLDLREALKRLPEKYRLPLILHYQDGYSLRETAQMLGISEKLVKSRLHQARGNLKQLLGGDQNEA